VAADRTGIDLKIERAKKHLRDLETALERFNETDPHEVVTKNNGEWEKVIGRVDPLPDCLALITGDVVHNLRSALDHLIWQLVIANGGEPEKDPTRYSFPIWDSAAKTSFPGKAKGVSPAALKIIEGLKPYKGGNEALWAINYLDVVDKHRLLLAAAATAATMTIDMVAAAHAMKGERPPPAGTPTTLVRFKMKAQPLYVGMFLGRSQGGTRKKRYEDAELAFGVALNEPEIGEPEPIIPALQQLIDATEAVVLKLGAEIH